MKRLLLLSFVGFFMITAGTCMAAIPHKINYQGMLTDDEGNPLNTPQDLTFRIYNVESGGTLLWGETQNNVPVDNGLFNVVLGSISTINLPFDENYWLELDVGPGEILTPRIQLTSVGYAYRAEIADTAIYAIEAVSAGTDGDWTKAGDNLYSAVAGSVGIGTGEPSAKLDVGGTLNQGAPGSGEAYDVNFYGYTTDYRMFWDASNVALRAGREYYNQWDDDSVGYCSFAIGYRTNASGDYSTALGYASDAEGLSSVAMGDCARAIGRSSVAMGRVALASGSASVAMGRETIASGWTSTAMGSYSKAEGEVSTAMGYHAHANGDTSIAIGKLVIADTSNTIVLGKGGGVSDWLVNNIPNSLMIGFNSATPTLFVDGSSVGIGTTSPAGILHIENSGSGEEAFLWIETSHPTNWHEAGIRIETPENKWHFRMDDDANKQIPAGALGLRSQNSGVETMTWAENGNVGIQKTNPAYALDVGGDINVSGNIRKGGTAYTHPDYVFEPDYELMSLENLKKYVSEKRCLPSVISAEEVKKNNGYNMDELLIQMLEKIEEQTLYIFQLEERIAALESRE